MRGLVCRLAFRGDSAHSMRHSVENDFHLLDMSALSPPHPITPGCGRASQRTNHAMLSSSRHPGSPPSHRPTRSGCPALAALLVLAAAAPWATTSLARADEADSGVDALRQVAGVLDYIAGDYRVAVNERGEVIHVGEYEEQLELARNADALAASAGLAEDDPVREELASLLEALRSKASPATIAKRSRSAREKLIRVHGLTLAPRVPPDYERAAELYTRQGCVRCHGPEGGANTEAARKLEPPPADFLDPERMATVSPHRAFYAITFGVEGTGMPPAPQLSDAERWSLAFYTLSLRHPQHLVDQGRKVLQQAPAIEDSPKALARMTDEELRDALREAVPSPRDRAAAMAYLRASAPFEQTRPESRFRVARQKLQEGLRAYERGDHEEARSHFVAAYLDGFEPHEASLRARDAELMRDIERGMLALRSSASRSEPAEHVAARTREVLALLERAQREGERVGSGHTAFLGALAITLREGLEIALLVGALLGLVRKRGRPQHARYVHAGWLLAIPAGLLTWLLAGELLGGLERELAEGLVAIAASIVLLGVTHWLVGQLSARRWMGFLARKAEAASAHRGSAFAVLALAFVAAYREAFEIVLFFKALLLDAATSAHMIWLGAAAGGALLVVVTLVLRLVGQRLKPRPFMIFSSVLLAGLSVVLLGKGVRSLQEAGWIAATELAVPHVPSLGLYGTTQGLLAQGLLLALLAASALWPWWSGRGAERHSGAAA